MKDRHRHVPGDDRVRGHGRFDYRCLVCGRFIVWIYPLPDRAGHWRAG